jgi:hypothetical protein
MPNFNEEEVLKTVCDNLYLQGCFGFFTLDLLALSNEVFWTMGLTSGLESRVPDSL